MAVKLKKYRYEVCITIPEKFKIDSDSFLETTILPKCKYAVTSVSGDFNLVVAATNYLFDNWLINSLYECEAQHGLRCFWIKKIYVTGIILIWSYLFPLKQWINGKQ